jgi:hypothetical protein
MHPLAFLLKINYWVNTYYTSSVTYLKNIEAQEIDWLSANITGSPNIAKRRQASSKADWAPFTAKSQPNFFHFSHVQ